jgi:high-affinity Fe2+/Pb2+ permease
MEVLGLIALIGILLLLVVGFHALDNWHKRKAWRDADRGAREYMRRYRGVEQNPDGTWRKI